MNITVKCQKRPENINPRALRRQGLIPSVLYGHKGTESVSLVLPEKEAYSLLKDASVNNTLVNLEVAELPWSGQVLIREVQNHPWKPALFHLSFFSVGSHASIEVAVPINLVGEARGAKQGGILEQMLNELKVTCAPGKIPESIEIDISDLDIGSHLEVGNLTIPEGITVIEDPQIRVLVILAPNRAEDATVEAES